VGPLEPNRAWKLTGLQAPQETVVTALVLGDTLREGKLGEATHARLVGSLQTTPQSSRDMARLPVGTKHHPTTAALGYSQSRRAKTVWTSRDFSDRGLEITASTSLGKEAFRAVWF